MPDLIYIPESVNAALPEARRRITHPFHKLDTKYLLSRANFRTFDFDLYGAQRADGAWENRVEGADWYATLLMRSFIHDNEIDRVMRERAGQIEQALTAIPAGITLDPVTLNDQELCAKLATLFNAVRGPTRSGISLAKVTKLLCLKRPMLIPMLDRNVCLGLGSPIVTSVAPAFGPAVIDIIRAFQAILVWSGIVDGEPHDNQDKVNALAAEITLKIDGEMENRGCGWAGCRPVVTPVRVLESLIWFDWGGWKNWPTMWQEGPAGIEPAP